MLDAPNSIMNFDLPDMRKYGTRTWVPTCLDFELLVFIPGPLHIVADSSAFEKTYLPGKAKFDQALGPLQTIDDL